MKRVFIMIALVGMVSWTMTSCGGGKKEEAKAEEETDAYSDYETEPAKPSTEDLIAQGQALTDKSDCKTCHHPTNKLVGPSHTEVAQKYEFTQANVTLLANKIISGGSGSFGEVPMSAHADLSLGDAEKMAMYVLSLDGEKMK